jgi:hypothetical protein
MSTSPGDGQISLLRSRAAVFRRKAFKHAVWVGICYDSTMLPKWPPIEIVIFYDSKYSEDQIWDSYSWPASLRKTAGGRIWEDLSLISVPRLIIRYGGFLRVLYATTRTSNEARAQTLYEDFNILIRVCKNSVPPVLRKRKSIARSSTNPLIDLGYLQKSQ